MGAEGKGQGATLQRNVLTEIDTDRTIVDFVGHLEYGVC